jgi:hypothetical protein
MSIYTCITSCACQLLPLLERDVLPRLGIYVPLRQAVVDQVDDVRFGSGAHAEILRLHISMQKLLAVKVIQSGDHLLAKEQPGLQREFGTAVLVEVLDRCAEELSHHHIKVSFLPCPVEHWDALLTLQDAKNFRLVEDLGEFD